MIKLAKIIATSILGLTPFISSAAENHIYEDTPRTAYDNHFIKGQFRYFTKLTTNPDSGHQERLHYLKRPGHTEVIHDDLATTKKFVAGFDPYSKKNRNPSQLKYGFVENYKRKNITARRDLGKNDLLLTIDTPHIEYLHIPKDAELTIRDATLPEKGQVGRLYTFSHNGKQAAIFDSDHDKYQFFYSEDEKKYNITFENNVNEEFAEKLDDLIVGMKLFTQEMNEISANLKKITRQRITP